MNDTLLYAVLTADSASAVNPNAVMSKHTPAPWYVWLLAAAMGLLFLWFLARQTHD